MLWSGLEAAGTDPVQRGGDTSLEIRERRKFDATSRAAFIKADPMEGQPACEGLIEECPQGVDVGSRARRSWLVRRLFGAHVPRVSPRCRAAGTAGAAVEPYGEAEIHELGLIPEAEDHVGRAEVEVQHAFAMGMVDRIAQLGEDAGGPRGGIGPPQNRSASVPPPCHSMAKYERPATRPACRIRTIWGWFSMPISRASRRLAVRSNGVASGLNKLILSATSLRLCR